MTADADLEADLLKPQANPYIGYRRLREADPVHWSEAQGGWILTRHADILGVLRDPSYSSDPRKGGMRVQQTDDASMRPMIEMALGRIMLFSDPPDHTRLRGLVSKAFTPRRVEELRPRIQQIFDELLDQAMAKGSTIDVIEDLAYPLPVIVIAEMMGAPPEDREQFKQWSRPLAKMIDPFVTDEQMKAAAMAAMAFVQYLVVLIEERRANPRNDVLSAMVAAEEEGDKLEVPELLANFILLLIAGHETTMNLIGNGLTALFAHPDQLAALRDEPDLAKNAVEEILRYDGTVQLTVRTPLEEKVIDGHTIEPLQQVVVLLGAANHDPAVFENPDALDIRREDARHHVAFGSGAHFCLGAPLARAEAQIALLTLLQRFPKLQLAVDEVRWRDSVTLRGVVDLPVTLTR